MLSSNFFTIENDILPKRGRVLVSEPFLTDDYFRRSVVLLTEHNENGSIGFIINNKLKVNLNDVLSDFPVFNAPVSIGGPVSTSTLHYLHTVGKILPESFHVFDNVFWGNNFKELKELISAKLIQPSDIRFFAGYSGWTPKQLDQEIQRNSWIVTELESDIVMNYYFENVWKYSLKKLGNKYSYWADFPEDPEMN